MGVSCLSGDIKYTSENVDRTTGEFMLVDFIIDSVSEEDLLFPEWVVGD